MTSISPADRRSPKGADDDLRTVAEKVLWLSTPIIHHANQIRSNRRCCGLGGGVPT